MKRSLLLILVLALLVAACGGESPATTQATTVPPTLESTPTAPQMPQGVEEITAEWESVNHYWSYSGSGEPGQGPMGYIEVWDLNGNSVQVNINWASTRIAIDMVDSNGNKSDMMITEYGYGIKEPFKGVLIYYYNDPYDIYFQVFWDPTVCGPIENPHPYEG